MKGCEDVRTEERKDGRAKGRRERRKKEINNKILQNSSGVL